MVIVHTLHVIPEVPLAGESVARLGALATWVGAAEGLLAMAVPSMSLTLVAEETSSGRELGAVAGGNPAGVGLQVRVNELAVSLYQ